MNITLFDMGQRFINMTELAGDRDNPFIVWSHSLCGLEDAPDEVPWCSSWLNACAWLLRLPRSKSARARSWLEVGKPILPLDARAAYDVVILSRGTGKQPGPDVINAPGHVGIYAGHNRDFIEVLGGNQGDRVSIARYTNTRILGLRRLYGPAP